jgi:hypothetical protein
VEVVEVVVDSIDVGVVVDVGVAEVAEVALLSSHSFHFSHSSKGVIHLYIALYSRAFLCESRQLYPHKINQTMLLGVRMNPCLP